MSAKQPLALLRAKNLREHMTKPEDRLWFYLREQKKVFGKFRRQEPIDLYIADFCSYEHRLIIELDGSNHIPEQDTKKDRYLASHGFKVLRFNNRDVLQNIQMVLDNIYMTISITPSPNPSRKGRGKLLSRRQS